MKRELRRYNRKHGRHHPILALDFENNPDTGAFICAGVFGDIRHRTSVWENGKPKVKWTTKRVEHYFTEQQDVVDFIIGLPRNSCTVVFFNLSYDRVYLDEIIDHGTLLEVGNRVIMAGFKNGLQGLDLMNHTSEGTLEDWIGHLEMGKKYGVQKAELTDYEARVMNDTKATYYLGSFIEDFYYYECGIPLRLTVGSAALRLFTMKFFTDWWERESDFLSEFERRAYYGGRCELFQRGTLPTYSYDVHSMYLSIMRDELVPDISTARYIESKPKKWREYLENYLGVWRVRVHCPTETYLPLLPVRMDNKLKFPTGTFDGYWTSPELLEAERNGYKILEVYDFIYFRQSKPYFRAYAEFVWKKRTEYKAKGNKGMDILIKYLGNTLYGKFAQRNGDHYFGRLSDFKGDLPNKVRFFERFGETWVQIKGELTPAEFEFPAIAAIITSHARIKLHRAMKANEDTLIYVDTDSLKLTAPAVGITIGSGLGEWGEETAGDMVVYHRPKLYGTKRKGVPKRAEKVETTKDGETWKYKKPLRYREAIRAGQTPNVWVEVLKHLQFQDDKRNWDGQHSVSVEYIDK